MIKTSDLATIQQTQSTDLARIEEFIDLAITRHHVARRPWPLVIPTTRAGWSQADIRTVLTAYRGAGWSVLSGGDRAMCVMEPSVPGTIANRVDDELGAALDRDGEVPELEPGWVERAVDRAKRDGVLPSG